MPEHIYSKDIARDHCVLFGRFVVKRRKPLSRAVAVVRAPNQRRAEYLAQLQKETRRRLRCNRHCCALVWYNCHGLGRDCNAAGQSFRVPYTYIHATTILACTNHVDFWEQRAPATSEGETDTINVKRRDDLWAAPEPRAVLPPVRTRFFRRNWIRRSCATPRKLDDDDHQFISIKPKPHHNINR